MKRCVRQILTVFSKSVGTARKLTLNIENKRVICPSIIWDSLGQAFGGKGVTHLFATDYVLPSGFGVPTKNDGCDTFITREYRELNSSALFRPFVVDLFMVTTEYAEKHRTREKNGFF